MAQLQYQFNKNDEYFIPPYSLKNQVLARLYAIGKPFAMLINFQGILAGCPEGGMVLDPFAGSGTTGAVAKRLGRSFTGVEINPAYCKIAADRIAAS